MPYRMIQWATGSMGQIAIRAFAERADFELVGVYVTTPEKDGRDAGELAGIDHLGVPATTDADTVLALDADCVYYAPLRADVDEVARILASGKNVVTTCGWLAPDRIPALDRARLDAACAAGGTSLHGTGVHPGYLGELVALVLARLSQRVDRVLVHETGDLSHYPSPAIFDMMGFGRLPDDQATPEDAPISIDDYFAESIALLAQGLDVKLDEVRSGHEVAVTRHDVTVAAGDVGAGRVGGKRFRWTGIVGGEPRIEFTTTYWITEDLDPQWELEPAKYTIVLEGEPSLRCGIDPVGGEGGAIGRVWAAMAALNAVPDVCAAAPGVRSHLDLPLVVPRGVMTV
jgi:2,4-diaminopentanoate dehydrogenase